MASDLTQSDGHDLSPFERIKKINDAGVEYWDSRELAKVLEYTKYANFLLVLEKAKLACFNSGHRIEDHFADIGNMVQIGSGAKRQIASVLLSRYACYLVIQNADPSKEIVALGQTYFAVQTRLRELAEQEAEEDLRLKLREEMRRHNLKLADAAKDAGVIQPIDYAIFQNHGYMGLYDGLDARGIHRRKALKPKEQILDHMGSTELAANLFRATQAEDKLRRERISGKAAANKTHFEVGAKVRQTIKELGGTMPEDLPVAPDIKKIEAKSAKKKALSAPKTTKRLVK